MAATRLGRPPRTRPAPTRGDRPAHRRGTLAIPCCADKTQRNGSVYLPARLYRDRQPGAPAMISLRRWSVLCRRTCLLVAAVTLAGCVVVPPPWHPYGPRYDYYR